MVLRLHGLFPTYSFNSSCNKEQSDYILVHMTRMIYGYDKIIKASNKDSSYILCRRYLQKFG